MLTPCERYIRARLFLGLPIESMWSVAVGELRVPFINHEGRAVSPTIHAFATRFAQTPEGPSAKRVRFDPLQADEELSPDAYASKYGLIPYLGKKGQLLLIRATELWANAAHRAYICGRLLRKQLPSEIAERFSAEFVGALQTEEVDAFRDLMWDLTPFSGEDVVRMLDAFPAVKAAIYSAREEEDEVLRRLGIIQGPTDDIEVIQAIKSTALRGLQEMQASPRGVHATNLQKLTELYLKTLEAQGKLEDAARERDSFGEDESVDSVSFLTIDAVSRYEEVLLPGIEREQRLMEVEDAQRNELLTDEQAEAFVARIHAGEDIGDEVRKMLGRIANTPTDPTHPPTEEDLFE